MRPVPPRTANMRPNDWADKRALRAHRTRIATPSRQLTAAGIRRLHARTARGVALKPHATLLAAALTNAH